MAYSDWVRAMHGVGPIGSRIVENIAADAVLPATWRAEFHARVERLFDRYRSAGGPIRALVSAIDGRDENREPLDFKGGPAQLGAEGSLSTFLREGDTPRDWLLRSGVNEAHLLEFVLAIVQRRLIADDSYRIGTSPRTRKVWFTFTSHVDSRRRNGYDISRLRDLLGLSHVRPGEALVELDCSTQDAGNALVPTSLDAGDHPSFLPSTTPKPATGTTRDLRTGGAGLPEVVTAPVPVGRFRCGRGKEVIQPGASGSF